MKVKEENNYCYMSDDLKYRKPKIENARLTKHELESVAYILSKIPSMYQKRELLVELMLQVDDPSFIALCKLINQKELDEIMPSC